MKPSNLSFEEFSGFIRRRKMPFLVPFILLTAACTAGAFLIPKEYESSTTILVQGEKVLNPLVDYTMAVAMQSDDQLRNFNEIVYSTPIIEALMDSLGMQPLMKSDADRQQLTKTISSKIKTDRNASDSFTISYFADSPQEAQKAVMTLAQLFIQTRLRIENSKNDFAVQFFSQRLNSLRDKFERSQQQVVDAMRQHVNALPKDDRDTYAHIDDFDKEIRSLQNTVDDYQRALSVLRKELGKQQEDLDINSLYELPLLGVPYADQLKSTLKKYDELEHTYTKAYPGVQDQRAALLQLLRRTEGIIESDLGTKQSQIWDLEKERHKSIETVQQATIAQSQNQDVQSNFNIYKDLYNDMKIKLEQAQTSRDLGENGAKEFVVINPPQLPTRAAKPNRPLMIAGGFSLGLILGLFAAGLAEILDPRIRRPLDIEIYDKPVIAYLPVAEPDYKRLDQ